MFAKWVVLGMLVVIFWSLGSGLFYLIKDPTGKKRTVKALTWRIILSLALFLMLFLGYALGLITPHAIFSS